ncbi:hypothetical protein PV326_004886 [Microctonus aethiopoides]|nr:hypothetical protein PV326_004886 [Microctonus aethiopoides]
MPGFTTVLKYGANLIYAGELAIKGAKDLHLTSYTKYLNTLGKHTDMITLFKSSLKSIVETSETGGKIVRLLDVHGNVIQESVRYVGHILESGNLAKFASIINKNLKISNKITKAFAKFTQTTVHGRVSNLMKNIREFQLISDAKGFIRNVKNEKEFLHAVEKNKLTGKITILERIIQNSTKVGTIALTVVGGLTVYELLKKHAQQLSGCWRFSVNGRSCKVAKFSKNENGTNICTNVHNVKNNDEQGENLNEFIGNCRKCCDNKYLDIPPDDREKISYRCLDLDIWDAMTDIIGNVGNTVSKIFEPKNLLIIGASIAIVGITIVTLKRKMANSTNHIVADSKKIKIQ